MAARGLSAFGSPEMALLNEAFKSPAGWEAFKTGVATHWTVADWAARQDRAVTGIRSLAAT